MEGFGMFFEMGGYAGFVWPAFGLTAVVMVALVVSTLRQLAQNRRRLEMLETAQASQKRGLK